MNLNSSSGTEKKDYQVTGSISDQMNIPFSEAFKLAVAGDCYVKIFSIVDVYENLIDHIETPKECFQIISEFGYGMNGLQEYLEKKGVVL
ncbi:hypothetical protein JWG44_05515 [Leptospira sp. 201903071]|uniref:hypothetical protein n=1 Tax=Leptospira ainazelensis TaxID=2810034 RepID=UPI0019644389|nr:hypothetical protein [Leptospira ainazelensis]MBM9499708.1 hypothetical protein [Leptospira ainazelensis]